jgi:hypothetical protein
MAKRGKVEVVTDKKDEHWIICPSCHTETAHSIIISVERTGTIEEWLHFSEEYQVVQCNGCKELSFRRSEHNSDDFHVDEQTGETVYEEHIELYPARLEGRKRLDDEHFVPPRVRNIYRETFQALCGGQLILAGIGIRALVEAVCHDRSAKGRNLERRIDSLVELGVLTPEGATILHSLRHLGNKAAHEVEPSDPYTLGLAYDVVEYLLNSVYIIPAKGRTLDESKKAPRSNSAE